MQSLSIRELKEIIRNGGLDIEGCIEKSDLVARAAAASEKAQKHERKQRRKGRNGPTTSKKEAAKATTVTEGFSMQLCMVHI